MNPQLSENLSALLADVRTVQSVAVRLTRETLDRVIDHWQKKANSLLAECEPQQRIVFHPDEEIREKLGMLERGLLQAILDLTTDAETLRRELKAWREWARGELHVSPGTLTTDAELRTGLQEYIDTGRRPKEKK